jgi:hypothetical protein
MKKVFFLALSILFFSCSVNNDENLVQTFIVASEQRICDGFIENQQCFLIKENENQPTWSFFSFEILGFNYESGFEYVIRINREYLPENANIADSPVYRYTLLETLSKIEKTSEGI